MKLKKLSLLLLGVFILGGGALAHSYYGSGKTVCLKSMGLSEAEIAEVKEIKFRHKEEGIKIRALKDIAVLHLEKAIIEEKSNDEIKGLLKNVLRAKRDCLLNRVDCVRESSRVIKDESVRKAYLEKMTKRAISFGGKKCCDKVKNPKKCDYNKDKTSKI